MRSVKEILYKYFSEDAIRAAAIGEQLEDIAYCSEHGMDHMNGSKEETKWNSELKKGKVYLERDNCKTFNETNAKRFRKEVDKFLSYNPGKGLYDGLNETEEFAVQRFYYFNNY